MPYYDPKSIPVITAVDQLIMAWRDTAVLVGVGLLLKFLNIV